MSVREDPQLSESTLKDFISGPYFHETVIRGRDESWPRISVVTPSYNQGRFLEHTILSVLNQNYPNLEFIIMDAGSTDHSLEIIRKYEKYLGYWKSLPDEGQAAAIGDGFSIASGLILAYLNSDDVYLPGTLRRVGEFFREQESAQFVYGDCLVIDSDNSIIRRIYPIEFDRDIFTYYNVIIPQPAAFWRRDLYVRAGGISRTRQFCMDRDLWARFMGIGTTFIRIKDVLAAFRWHKDSKTSRLNKINQQEGREIFQDVMGRPIRRADSIRTAYFRLKRYCLGPRGFIEGLRTSLLGFLE